MRLSPAFLARLISLRTKTSLCIPHALELSPSSNTSMFSVYCSYLQTPFPLTEVTCPVLARVSAGLCLSNCLLHKVSAGSSFCDSLCSSFQQGALHLLFLISFITAKVKSYVQSFIDLPLPSTPPLPHSRT